MADKKIGEITHYYTNIGVGIIKLSDTLKVGQTVKFVGATTDFEQEIDEMQYNHENIEEIKKGKEVGIKVKDKVRDGDEVYLVE
jgi:putative protease